MKARSDPEIIIAFLKKPLEYRSFLAFFNLCYQKTIAYLRYLGSRGYYLHDSRSNPEKEPADLAIDILGSFLRKEKNVPFSVIFDFFERNGLSNFDSIDPDTIDSQFQFLLFGFIRRELKHIGARDNPQIDNLKRRFRDILSAPPYMTASSPDKKSKEVSLRPNSTMPRKDRPFLPYEMLLRMAEECYLESRSREEWCRNIFSRLDDKYEYRNALLLHELLRAVVIINIKYVEPETFRPSGLLPPALEENLEAAISAAIVWCRDNPLARFRQKRNLSDKIAENLLTAVHRYLIDRVLGGATDSIPEYFRETMPDVTPRQYLDEYKHIFETTIKETLKFLRDLLRKNPTISGFGDYIDYGN